MAMSLGHILRMKMIKRWQAFERDFAERLSGKVQARSGGIWFARMDVMDKTFLWSLKDTIGNSFSVKNSDLDEVSFNASKTGSIPGMAIRVNNTEYAILKMNDLISLVESDATIVDKDKTKSKREIVRQPPLLRE